MAKQNNMGQRQGASTAHPSLNNVDFEAETDNTRQQVALNRMIHPAPLT
jgi:hypothetical protein